MLIDTAQDQEIEEWVASYLIRAAHHDKELQTRERGMMLESLALETVVYQRYSQSWPGQINRLLRSRVEEVALGITIGNMPSPVSDHRLLHLRKLIQVGVPKFVPDIQSLVSMRQNEESFA